MAIQRRGSYLPYLSAAVSALAICLQPASAAGRQAADQRAANVSTVVRFIEIAYPELKGEKTDIRNESSGGSAVEAVITRSDGAGGEVNTLLVEAEVVKSRLAKFLTRGPYVHTDALDDLEARWAQQDQQPGVDQVDQDLRRLGARFTSERGKELEAVVVPRLRRELGVLRATPPRLEWIAKNRVGQPVTQPFWWLIAEVNFSGGSVLCYRVVLEPIDGRIVSLAEVSNAFFGGTPRTNCD